MANAPDTTVSFDRNTPRLIYMIVICCVFCYGSFLLTQGWAYESKGTFSIVVGWLALVVFGFFLILGLLRLTRSPKTTLVFSPAGVLDRRLLDKPIPWRDITKISQKKVKGHEFLGIQITEQGKQQLSLNLQGKVSFKLNAIMDKNTLWISTYELEDPFAKLWQLMCQFLQEHNRIALPNKSSDIK